MLIIIRMRRLFPFLITMLTSAFAFAQQDTVRTHADTLRVLRQQYIADSMAVIRQKLIADSVSLGLTRTPDPNRHNQFIDSVIKNEGFDGLLFKNGKPKYRMGIGTERRWRNQWVIAVIIVLLIYTGLLNGLFGKDIDNVVQAFYDSRAFGKMSKDDNLLNSWAFICFFLLFGFTVGLYIFLTTDYLHNTYLISGFELFMAISVAVIILFALKILILRLLAFTFDVKRLVSEYISVLYLTYFNIAFVFLPLVICLSLLPVALIPWLLRISIGLVAVIFGIQYVRSTINVISNFRFRKIYLFIYLCALEICPILIIIKALDT